MSNTFGIPHRALKDTTLCGYTIPKDTMLLGDFRGMMTDPETWTDPDSYRPERFLLNGKLNVPANYHPFGLGKHRCMGELMGRSNIFSFITTLFQRFEFKVPPGHPMPSSNF
jgi:cytochrome P450